MKKSDLVKTRAQITQALNRQQETVAHKRRQFLQMVANSGISASLLRATPLAAGLMANRFAHASEIPPKRVIFLCFPGGAPAGTWMPTDINTMNASTQAYKNVAKHCNFYLADLHGGGQGYMHYALGGRVSKTTFDMQLAETLGVNTPYPKLTLSIETNATNDLLSRKNGQPVRPFDNPQFAYDSIFGGPATNTTTYTKHKLALDANLAGLNAIQSKLSADEKLVLEQHTHAISTLQKELEQTQQGACNKPVLPSSTDAVNDIAKTLRLQIDIAVAALQCGLTNVASIQFSDSQADWVYNGPTFSSGHHVTTHGRPQAAYVEIMNYLGRNGAYLLERLLNTDDSEGKKLIESTVFAQVTNEGDMTDHTTTQAPHIVASKIPAFKAGTVGLRGDNITLLDDIAKGVGITTLSDFHTPYSSGILV